MEPCDEIRGWLGAFADGELGRTDTGKVEAHLASCPGCRREIEEILALESALASDSRAGEPPDEYFSELPGRVEARFDLEAAARHWTRPASRETARSRPIPLGARAWFRLALGSATVVVVALVIRLTQHSPLRPESFDVKMNELSREYREWQQEQPRRVPREIAQEGPPAAPPEVPRAAPPVGILPAEPHGVPEGGRRKGEEPLVQEVLPAGDEELTAGGLALESTIPATEPVPVPPPVAGTSAPASAAKPEELPSEPIAASRDRVGSDQAATPIPADALVAWGRELASRWTESEPKPIPDRSGRFENEVTESTGVRSMARIAAQRSVETSAQPIGPADLLLREADASLSDSAWVRGWRSEARRLADLALLAPAPERCRIALAAYYRLGHRGGRQVFADPAERQAAFLSDRERIGALLRCLDR